MRSQERDHNGRVDEDDEVGDNHERRTLDLTPLHASAAFLTAREIVATFEKETRNDRKSSRKARKRLRDGQREACGAGGSVTGKVSERRCNVTISLPCHGSRNDKVYDADERDKLFPRVAGHLGGIIPELAGHAMLIKQKRRLQEEERGKRKGKRESRGMSNGGVSV